MGGQLLILVCRALSLGFAEGWPWDLIIRTRGRSHGNAE